MYEKATFKVRQSGEKWESAPVVCVLENQGFCNSLFESQCDTVAGALSRLYYQEIRYNFDNIDQGHYTTVWNSRRVSPKSVYITALHVEDVENHLGVTPTIAQLHEIAENMESAYVSDLYWSSMKDIAKEMGLI